MYHKVLESLAPAGGQFPKVYIIRIMGFYKSGHLNYFVPRYLQVQNLYDIRTHPAPQMVNQEHLHN